MAGHGLTIAFPREDMIALFHVVEREAAAEVDLWIGVEDLFAVVMAVLEAAGEDRQNVLIGGDGAAIGREEQFVDFAIRGLGAEI